MAESIPVGCVRAQRFIALHLIANAGRPTSTPSNQSYHALRTSLAARFQAANLTSGESYELSKALAYLAYNMTCSGRLWQQRLDVKADWTFHVYKRPGGGSNRVPAALLPKALDLWKQGEAIGVLALTDESVEFCRTETRLFFCAQFILSQPLDPAHLRWLSRRPFADAWTVSAALDPELADRLEAILRTSRHPRAPLWAARILSTLGTEAVSRLFWSILGSGPEFVSASGENQEFTPQDEAKASSAHARELFRHCLIRALRYGDGQAREYCGHLLRHDSEVFGTAGDPLLAAELMPLLLDEEPEVRIEAGASLLRLNAHTQPMVGSVMRELLHHTDPHIRWDAAIVMARAGGRSMLEPLLEAMKGGSHGQRHAAMRCLGDLGDPRAVPALIDVLRDPSDSLRAGAIYPLALLRDRRAVPALIHYAEETLAWGSTDSLAIDALGWIGDDRAVDVCVHALSHKSGWVRSCAAQVLGRLGSRRAVPALIQLLRSEQYPDARMHAADALGAIGDPSAVDVLIEVMNGSTWAGRRQAIYSLGLLGGSRAVETLISALEGASDEDSTSAAWSLARSVTMEARDPLLRAIESAIKAEKRTVYALMMHLGQLDRDMAVPYLLQVLNDPSGRGHASAIEALGRLGDPRAITALRHYEPPTDSNTEWLKKSVRDALLRLQARRPARTTV